MKILFIGDVVAKGGRNSIRAFVPALIESESIDFVIANGENAAGGKGIDEKTAKELFDSGVDLITGGNHSWDKKDAMEYLAQERRILRPYNYPDCGFFKVPGLGSAVLEKNGQKLAVLNLLGQVHMEPKLECPFNAAIRWLDSIRKVGINCTLVDFHAEATSEKQAMGHFLTGKASAVLGSHSHVQTADERIFENAYGRTAYITDAGMTGPYDSVIGMKKENSIHKFLTKMPVKYEPAENKNGLHGVVVDIDSSGSAVSIQRLSLFME